MNPADRPAAGAPSDDLVYEDPTECATCGSPDIFYDPGEGWSCGNCWLTDLTPYSEAEARRQRVGAAS